MSDEVALGPIPDQSGTGLVWTSREEGALSEHRTAWRDIWSEVTRTRAVRELPRSTGPSVVCIIFEALPVSAVHFATTTKDLLDPIEVAFGSSVTNLAKILRVSRPTIYHYREGKEPAAENKRRLRALAELISSIDRSLETDLQTEQPEGRSLLDLLSDIELDYVALRRVIHRSLEGRRRDRSLRRELAGALRRTETVEERRDILRERHASNRHVYIGDPNNPGKLVQMLPDGRRIRGQMVNREFVPDER